jgi:predicted dinucleotide-binding enzyme
MDKKHFADLGRRDFIHFSSGLAAMLGLSVSPLAAWAQTAGGEPLKIATIGAGRIGSTLGSIWVKAGHPVMFSSRHPEKLKDLVDGLGPLARAGTPAEAIAFADVVLLAVPYNAMPQVAADFARELAAKALVIDATNPIERRDGEMAVKAREKGAGTAAAELLPGVKLVRAFNAIGYARMSEASKMPPNARIGMPIAGDDAKAIAMASTLIMEIGYEPVLIGPMKMGDHLLPGTPLAGERSAEEIRKILTTLSNR